MSKCHVLFSFSQENLQKKDMQKSGVELGWGGVQGQVEGSG